LKTTQFEARSSCNRPVHSSLSHSTLWFRTPVQRF